MASRRNSKHAHGYHPHHEQTASYVGAAAPHGFIEKLVAKTIVGSAHVLGKHTPRTPQDTLNIDDGFPGDVQLEEIQDDEPPLHHHHHPHPHRLSTVSSTSGGLREREEESELDVSPPIPLAKLPIESYSHLPSHATTLKEGGGDTTFAKTPMSVPMTEQKERVLGDIRALKASEGGGSANKLKQLERGHHSQHSVPTTPKTRAKGMFSKVMFQLARMAIKIEHEDDVLHQKSKELMAGHGHSGEGPQSYRMCCECVHFTRTFHIAATTPYDQYGDKRHSSRHHHHHGHGHRRHSRHGHGHGHSHHRHSHRHSRRHSHDHGHSSHRHSSRHHHGGHGGGTHIQQRSAMLPMSKLHSSNSQNSSSGDSNELSPRRTHHSSHR